MHNFFSTCISIFYIFIFNATSFLANNTEYLQNISNKDTLKNLPSSFSSHLIRLRNCITMLRSAMEKRKQSKFCAEKEGIESTIETVKTYVTDGNSPFLGHVSRVKHASFFLVTFILCYSFRFLPLQVRDSCQSAFQVAKVSRLSLRLRVSSVNGTPTGYKFPVSAISYPLTPVFDGGDAIFASSRREDCFSL